MKNLKMSPAVVLLIALVALTGCSDDDPVAPAPEPAPMVEVTWEAERLNVIEDCDASSGAGPGDFYISFTMSDYTSGEEVILADRRRVLVQVNKGSIAWGDDMDIVLKAEVPLKDGTRLLLNMSYFENDPDGPQVSVGNAWYYTYSEVSGRWESEDDDRAMDFGEPTRETLHLEDYQGDDCNVYLRGKFSMDPVLK